MSRRRRGITDTDPGLEPLSELLDIWASGFHDCLLIPRDGQYLACPYLHESLMYMTVTSVMSLTLKFATRRLWWRERHIGVVITR